MAAWAIGLAGSAMIAGLAWWKKALTFSGAIAAVAVGTPLFALGGTVWYVPLLAFFLSSSLLSAWKKGRKAETEAFYEKGSRRDAGQVLANGGLGTALCLCHALWPQQWWWIAFVGVMATVNADTWATEIGGALGQNPRSIITGKKVARGTSGGVSAAGLAASVAGGALIGLTALLSVGVESERSVYVFGWSAASLCFIGIAAGLLGSLADSVLGAAIQRMNRCQTCGHETEKKTHCGSQTRLVRGWVWMNNDAVNGISSAIGGLAACLFGLVLGK